MNMLSQKLKDAFKQKPKVKLNRLGPIGLHFAGEQLHAVQLRRSSAGNFYLTAWASIDYPQTREDILRNPQGLKKLVANLLARGSFKGKKVVTALPTDMAKIASLSYMAAEGKDAGQQLLDLMADRLEGPIGDYVVDYLPVRSTKKSREQVALVAASRRQDVVDFLEILKFAKLSVIELEISPAAINRLVGLLPAHDPSRDNVLVINYGTESSFLTLISGRRLMMDKELKFGANMLIEHVAKGLDVSPEMAESLIVREGLAQQSEQPFGEPSASPEEQLNPVAEIVRPLFVRLADDVRRACLYAAAETQGDAVGKVYTLGTIARWHGADQLLREVSRIPVADSFPLASILM